ncbi:MAG: hypothetical protein ACOC6P_03130 [Candidatus Aminicenantaceae bacterium]
MKKYAVLSICILVFVSLVFSHSLQIEVIKKSPFVEVNSRYGGKIPVINAEVKIYSPDDSSQEFQIGRTDQRGKFAFIPDKPGKWNFTVDDEMGHRKDTVIDISVDFFEKKEKDIMQETVSHDKSDTTFSRLPFYLKLIVGLCLIFGITGIFFWIKVRSVVKNKGNKG